MDERRIESEGMRRNGGINPQSAFHGVPRAHGFRRVPVPSTGPFGSLASGVPDLAERHREYVLAALKHGR